MKKLYAAKHYLEEVLLGANFDGIGLINESINGYFQKSHSYSGFSSNSDYSGEVVSVGLVAGNQWLELGVDSTRIRHKAVCDCLKQDICRKLMLQEVVVTPQRRYHSQLVLRAGHKVGHQDFVGLNTYGTLGYFLFPCKSGKDPYIISNSHVLAQSGNAEIGDYIYSLSGMPAPIGTLNDFNSVYVGTQNELDLAVGRLEGFDYQIPSMSAGYRNPIVGENVYKIGARTGTTSGVVRSTQYTAKIRYGNSDVVFTDQIQIIPSIQGRSFSQGGDSGSLIRSNSDDYFLGLLFAGNGSWTLANHQTKVIQQLNNWGYSIT